MNTILLLLTIFLVGCGNITASILEDQDSFDTKAMCQEYTKSNLDIAKAEYSGYEVSTYDMFYSYDLNTCLYVFKMIGPDQSYTFEIRDALSSKYIDGYVGLQSNARDTEKKFKETILSKYL